MTTQVQNATYFGSTPGAALRARLRFLRETFGTAMRTWSQRRRARNEFHLIDARSLREIGIAPCALDYDLRQPFWRPLRDLRR
jgi:uncharacterized protein YjiS (DUF1127 family)